MPGVGVRRAHRLVRELVDPLAEDRVPSGDMTALADAIANGLFDFTVSYDHASV
jgi:histidine ammonia-lyase